MAGVEPTTGQTPSTVSPKDRAVQESLSQVLLAREQARLGFYTDAGNSWKKAIDVLAPFAVADSDLTTRIRQIQRERDEALQAIAAEAPSTATNDQPEDEGEPPVVEDADEPPIEGSDEAAAIIEGPEPALDAQHGDQVEAVVRDIQPDYPIVTNDRVLAWVDAWTGRLRDFMWGSLTRSGPYVERFQQIFAEEGLPKDLVFMAHVESGFKTTAYSRARARGIFQFITGTGSRYGLQTSRWIDERADPEKSCRAAARYLRDLYTEFGDWYLSLAAYNCGEGKIRRVINQTGLRDFWDPKFQRYLRHETRNYVPGILAATLIAKNPAKFGFGNVVPAPLEPTDTVTLAQPTNLQAVATATGTDVETLRRLNPALRRNATPSGVANFALRVPAGRGDSFAENWAKVPEQDRWMPVDIVHSVRRGETLASIGARYGISVAELRATNHISRKRGVRVGQRLVIPDGGTGGRVAKAAPAERRVAGTNGTRTNAASSKATKGANSTPTAQTSAVQRHTVQEGETLWRIAQNYSVELDKLLAANRLSKGSIIKPGMKLQIPGAAAPVSASPVRPTTAAGQKVLHVVQQGETLANIARRYRTSIQRLCSLNNLAPSATIYPGDTLTVAR